MLEEIPLFPLNTVLFPQANLSLRIFEPRYLSMVSDCLKRDKPFGVVLIKEGNEAGEAATFHDVGTLARIIDFDQLEDGYLGLNCLGQNRFRTINHTVNRDQLIVGQIELVTEPPPAAADDKLLTEYKSVRNFLRETLERKELEKYRQILEESWNDSDWISFQLAQLLPLSSDSRQVLLEMTTTERLFELNAVLKDNDLL